MTDLQIEIAENGFIATAKITNIVFSNEAGETEHITDKKWCFDSPEPLAEFVKDWANGSKKPVLKAECAET